MARDTERSGSAMILLGLTLLLGGAGVSMAAYWPAALVLPVMSVLMVVAGFAIAGGAWLAGFRIGHGPVPLWETAAALVFLGFAGTMLTDSEAALALLQQVETQGLASLSR
jgi:hypothetical protein